MKFFWKLIHVDVLYFLDANSKTRYMLEEYKSVKRAIKKGNRILAVFSLCDKSNILSSHEVLWIGKWYYRTNSGGVVYRYHEPSLFGF